MRRAPLALGALLIGWSACLALALTHQLPAAVGVAAGLVVVAGTGYALGGRDPSDTALWLAVLFTALGPVLAATAPFPHLSPTRRVLEVGALELVALGYACRDPGLRTMIAHALRWRGARLATLASCVAAVPLGVGVRVLAHPSPVTLSGSAGAGRLVAAVLAVTVFSALPEELVFRGVLTPTLSSFGPVALVAGTVVAYGGTYAIGGSWRLLLAAGVLGLAATAVRMRSRSLLPVVGAHCVLSITVLAAVH
jgi:membrane protease YdiL (CAAX protease family)